MEISDISIGAVAYRRVRVALEDILAFAKLTGDRNPLHTDNDFCKTTPFGTITAHGQLLGSYVVGLIGSEFPGPGWFCLGVSTEFVRPVFPNDELRVTVRAKQKLEILKVLVLEGLIENQKNEVVLRSVIKAKYLFDDSRVVDRR